MSTSTRYTYEVTRVNLRLTGVRLTDMASKLKLTFDRDPPVLTEAEFWPDGAKKPLPCVRPSSEKGPKAMAIFLIEAILRSKAEGQFIGPFTYADKPAGTLYESLDALSAWLKEIFGEHLQRIMEPHQRQRTRTVQLNFDSLHPADIEVRWRKQSVHEVKNLRILLDKLQQAYDPRANNEAPQDEFALHSSLFDELRQRLAESSGMIEVLVPPGYEHERVIAQWKRQSKGKMTLVELSADSTGSQTAFWEATFREMHRDSASTIKMPNSNDDGYSIFGRIKEILSDDRSNIVLLLHDVDQLVASWPRDDESVRNIKKFYSRLSKLKKSFVFGTIDLIHVLNARFNDVSKVDFPLARFRLCDGWEAWAVDAMKQAKIDPDSTEAKNLLAIAEMHPQAFREGLAAFSKEPSGDYTDAVNRVHATVAASILRAVPPSIREILMDGNWDIPERLEDVKALCRAGILRQRPAPSKRVSNKTAYEPAVVAWINTWSRR